MVIICILSFWKREIYIFSFILMLTYQANLKDDFAFGNPWMIYLWCFFTFRIFDLSDMNSHPESKHELIMTNATFIKCKLPVKTYIFWCMESLFWNGKNSCIIKYKIYVNWIDITCVFHITCLAGLIWGKCILSWLVYSQGRNIYVQAYMHTCRTCTHIHKKENSLKINHYN